MALVVQNVRVHLIDAGSGAPTLFLHGNPDSADMWRPVIDRLRDRLRCLAPDLPGFARSLAPADFDCSLEHLARFVNELLDALGVAAPINLVLHDLGGLYGLSWAVRHPARVQRIVISNMAYHADYRWHPWARIWRTPLLGELSMALTNYRLFAVELRRGSRRLSDAHIRRTYELAGPGQRRMVLRHYRAADPALFAPWNSELRALARRVPTMVLWGDADPYIAPRFAEQFGAGEVHHFPGVGHWLPAEDPAAFAAHLERFLL